MRSDAALFSRKREFETEKKIPSLSFPLCFPLPLSFPIVRKSAAMVPARNGGGGGRDSRGSGRGSGSVSGGVGEGGPPVVIVMGACCLDRILPVPSYPGPDAKIRTGPAVEAGGGNAANVALALGRLSDAPLLGASWPPDPASCSDPTPSSAGPLCRVVLITRVGTDGIGRGLREDLGGGGVDCTSPLFVAGPSGSTTSVTTVVVAEEGRTRACLHTPGTCGELGTGDVERALIGREEGFPEEGPEEGPEEALDDLFRDAAVFHTDTRHTGAALYLAREAVRRGILVSVDVEKDRGEAMERIVALASLVFGNVDRLREYALGLDAGSRHTEPALAIARHYRALEAGGDGAVQRDKCIVVTR